MHIYIDESGNFIHPQQKPHLISCVTALVVPHKEMTNVSNELSYFKKKFNLSGEVKGNQINEDQAKNLIKRLSKYNLFIYSETIDMGLHTPEAIEDHKKGQAGKFLNAVNEESFPSLIEEINELASKMDATPNQLYIQSMLLTNLCSKIIRKATLYYSQFLPAELGKFEWTLDSKGGSFEAFWKKVVSPNLQSIFLREPLKMAIEYDYTYFDSSYKFNGPSPTHLAPYVPEDASKEDVTDIKKLITGNLAFKDSKSEPGLQLVDLLASIISRGCNGNLQQSGWDELGTLFLASEKGTHPLGMLAFQEMNTDPNKLPYNAFFKTIYRKAKPIFRKSK